MKELVSYLGRLRMSGGDHDGKPFTVLPWERRFIMGPNRRNTRILSERNSIRRVTRISISWGRSSTHA